MSVAVARIDRSVTNGPVIYTFRVDDVVQKSEIGIATLNAAIDLIKPQIAAVPGTVQSATITVTIT